MHLHCDQDASRAWDTIASPQDRLAVLASAGLLLLLIRVLIGTLLELAQFVFLLLFVRLEGLLDSGRQWQRQDILALYVVHCGDAYVPHHRCTRYNDMSGR